jgi:hypothetical protein
MQEDEAKRDSLMSENVSDHHCHNSFVSGDNKVANITMHVVTMVLIPRQFVFKQSKQIGPCIECKIMKERIPKHEL